MIDYQLRNFFKNHQQRNIKNKKEMSLFELVEQNENKTLLIEKFSEREKQIFVFDPTEWNTYRKIEKISFFFLRLAMSRNHQMNWKWNNLLVRHSLIRALFFFEMFQMHIDTFVFGS